MRKWMSCGFVAVILICFCVVASDSFGRDREPGPHKVTLTGTVGVVKDDAGAVTAVSLTVKAPAPKEGEKARPDRTYVVVLDDNGKKLAELDGKPVVVEGSVTYKKGEGDKSATLVLTVTTSKEAPPAAPAPTEKKE